jgi:hypothetical protein
MTSFVKKIKGQKPLYIYSSVNFFGEPVWFVLKSDERKMAKLKSTTKEQTIDIRDYGVVVAKGLGAKPNDAELDKIKAEN